MFSFCCFVPIRYGEWMSEQTKWTSAIDCSSYLVVIMAHQFFSFVSNILIIFEWFGSATGANDTIEKVILASNNRYHYTCPYKVLSNMLWIKWVQNEMKRARQRKKRNTKTYRIINTLCCYLLSKTDSPKCFTLDPFRGVCSLRHRLCSFVSCLSLDTTYFSSYNERLAIQKMSIRAKSALAQKHTNAIRLKYKVHYLLSLHCVCTL